MPQGDKSAYTDKQKRMARHIEKSYENQGVSEDEAAARAWATVNKQTGGGKLSGSGRGKATGPGSRLAAVRSAAAKKAAASRSPEERSASAKKAAATRKRNAAAKKH